MPLPAAQLALGHGAAGLCTVQYQWEMAARFLYDRIDFNLIGIAIGIPAYDFLMEGFLIAAACDRQAREMPTRTELQEGVCLA